MMKGILQLTRGICLILLKIATRQIQMTKVFPGLGKGTRGVSRPWKISADLLNARGFAKVAAARRSAARV
jgi:hypothetical protein